MKQLVINKDLSLPLDLITMRTAEYGDSGSGKTAFARAIAEKVHEAHHRFCAIDLKNDWWGLKSSADGGAKGIPVVIFGGPRADVQLLPDAGAVVAETVASIEQSVIIDLDAMSKTKQIKFLAAFFDRLYEVNRHPILLICDEADRYAPQKPMSPEAIMSLSASEDVCRRGRKRGIGQMWLTQRTAVLNKNISDICQMTVVFRTPGARDLNELEDRVGRIASKTIVKEVMRLAPGLEDGEAFFLSSNPKLRRFMPEPVRPIQLPLPWTFDSSATPGVGQRRREPRVLAEADLVNIQAKMAEQVKAARENDPAEMRRRVVTLTRELEKVRAEKIPAPATPAPAPKPAKIERIKIPVLKEGQLKRVEKLADRLGDHLGDVAELATTFQLALAELGKIIKPALTPAAVPAAVPATSHVLTRRAATTTPAPGRFAERPAAHHGNGATSPARPAHRAAHQPLAEGEVDGPTRKILYSLAWWRAVGVNNPSVTQTAAIAGYAPSGTFDTYLSRAGAAGILLRDKSRVELLEPGEKLAPVVEAPGSLKDLHQMVLATLDGPSKKIVQALLNENGGSLRVEDLAAASDYAPSGTFDTYLSRLGSRGLLVRAKCVVSPTETLFPDALISEIGAGGANGAAAN